jgi:predicted amidophosphoribosyltransferase
LGEVGNKKHDATKVCTECGLNVKREAAVCEHCGNVFKKTPREQSIEEDRVSE